jgi:hypothetical protein
MYSIGHGTHPFVVTEQHCRATLIRIFGARKDIVNCWLRRNLNGRVGNGFNQDIFLPADRRRHCDAVSTSCPNTLGDQPTAELPSSR